MPNSSFPNDKFECRIHHANRELHFGKNASRKDINYIDLSCWDIVLIWNNTLLLTEYELTNLNIKKLNIIEICKMTQKTDNMPCYIIHEASFLSVLKITSDKLHFHSWVFCTSLVISQCCCCVGLDQGKPT